jgi:hypothetical protein
MDLRDWQETCYRQLVPFPIDKEPNCTVRRVLPVAPGNSLI